MAPMVLAILSFGPLLITGDHAPEPTCLFFALRRCTTGCEVFLLEYIESDLRCPSPVGTVHPLHRIRRAAGCPRSKGRMLRDRRQPSRCRHQHCLSDIQDSPNPCPACICIRNRLRYPDRHQMQSRPLTRQSVYIAAGTTDLPSMRGFMVNDIIVIANI